MKPNEEAGRIDVSAGLEGDRVVLSVRNARREGTAPNPGSSLGLVSTRVSAPSLWGEAELVTTTADDHFLARVSLPKSRTRAGREEDD